MVKKIHYIWLGRNKKSRKINKCIKSWERFFPGWEIIEWNEDNIDVDMFTYTTEAYNARKYAFASDVLRFQILEKYGGLYFDVDVEVIKPFDDLFSECDGFTGFENDRYVAPGLVLFSKNPNNPIISEMVESYRTDSFITKDGAYNQYTVGQRLTDILLKRGLKANNQFQVVNGFGVYPITYFNPMDYYGDLSNMSSNTHSVHLYLASWLSPKQKVRKRISMTIHRIVRMVK